MRAYDFVTRIPLELDRHRSFLIEDVALTRTSPPLSPYAREYDHTDMSFRGRGACPIVTSILINSLFLTRSRRCWFCCFFLVVFGLIGCQLVGELCKSYQY